MTAYDEYEITFTVRCARRTADRARRREPEEIGMRILETLNGMGMSMAHDARITVRPLP